MQTVVCHIMVYVTYLQNGKIIPHCSRSLCCLVNKVYTDPPLQRCDTDPPLWLCDLPPMALLLLVMSEHTQGIASHSTQLLHLQYLHIEGLRSGLGFQNLAQIFA